jgi:hypothetical protein
VIDDGPEGRERLRELDEGILAGLEGEYGLLSLGELGDVERGLGRGGGARVSSQRGDHLPRFLKCNLSGGCGGASCRDLTGLGGAFGASALSF